MTSDHESPYIVSAGRLIPEKGYDVLIRAFHALNRQDLVLVALGQGSENDRLHQLIKSLELEGRVHLPGHQSNPMPYLKHARLCVVSSNMEGFPNVLLQMMALNGNVVSTECADGIANIPGLPTCKPGEVALLTGLMRNQLDDHKDPSFFVDYLESRGFSGFWEKVSHEN